MRAGPIPRVTGPIQETDMDFKFKVELLAGIIAIVIIAFFTFVIGWTPSVILFG